jgi:hypothetical protein
MNQREPTSEPKGPGWTFPCLALLLLPLLSGVPAPAGTLTSLQAGLTQRKPYLVALGAPPLRFQEPAPAAELAIRPPKPSVVPQVTTDAVDDISEAIPPSSTEDSAFLSSTPALTTPPGATEALQPEITASTPIRSPRPILPDEMRPQARPEDFLPFFQIPAAQTGDVDVIVPVPRAPAAPSSLPRSSATYTQTPR